MHVYILWLSEAFCPFPVSSLGAQMGVWSLTFLTPWCPAGAAVSCQAEPALVSCLQLAKERGQQPDPSFFPHSVSSSFHQAGQSALLVDALPPVTGRHQTLTSCSLGVCPIRGVSAALPPWLGKAQMTSQLEKKLPGGFPTTIILANFSSAQSEWKELQMPQLS